MSIKFIFVAVCLYIFSMIGSSQAEVLEIKNPRKAPLQRTMQMEEVWRIGDDPDEPFVLGVIQRVISDEQGNFYLLDNQQSEVFKFSPDGEYLKSVSRKGEGPGEIGRCYFFGFWDTNTISCFSRFPHKFIRFDLEGIPTETLVPVPGPAHENDGRMAMSGFLRRDGHLVVMGSLHRFEAGRSFQKSFLSSYDENAEEIICYGSMPTGYDFSKPIVVDEEADFIPFRRWTLGRKGEVYIAPKLAEYLVEVHDDQGNLIRRITRDVLVRKRTKAEKEEAKNQYSFGVSGREMPEISYKISDYPRVITALRWMDDQLWIIPQRDEDDGSFMVDIFDGEGHLLEERSYILPMDKVKDRVFWLENGRAMVVKNYESAKVASRSSNVEVHRGDGKQELDLSEDFILEVILYRVAR